MTVDKSAVILATTRRLIKAKAIERYRRPTVEELAHRLSLLLGHKSPKSEREALAYLIEQFQIAARPKRKSVQLDLFL